MVGREGDVFYLSIHFLVYMFIYLFAEVVYLLMGGAWAWLCFVFVLCFFFQIYFFLMFSFLFLFGCDL